jgi:hypothetical protein
MAATMQATGLRAVTSLRVQALGEAFACEPDHCVGGGQDRLCRAVVLLQRDDCRRRLKARREVQDVTHVRGAEAVDRLRVVADDGEPGSIRLQAQKDAGLQRVGVLVLVDEYVIEKGADVYRQFGDGHQLAPVEQQIIVVEHALLLLGLHVGSEQALQVVPPLRAPGELLGQHPVERLGGVDGTRVDREARRFQRKPLRLVGEAELVAHEVHKIGGVLAVVDGEAGIEADRVRVHTQQAGADCVEGSRP